eukprot:jgi/Chlat1/3033/Chrsp206S03289
MAAAAAAAAAGAGAKVLLVGDVRGRLPQLCKRLAAVNKSNGPFDCAICVGDFFGGADAEAVLRPYADGTAEESLPIPLYFVGEAATPVHCPNVRPLGTAGVRELHGGNTAESDAVVVITAAAEGIVDLLLTDEWPQGVCKGVALPEGVPADCGSAVVADAALRVQPRYHVAARQGVFYAREPYANAIGHVTRFIALADVGNDKKQKYLHALSLTSAESMDSSLLSARPPNTTSNPYREEVAHEEAVGKAGRFRAIAAEEQQGNATQSWRYDVTGAKRARTDGAEAKVCFDFQKGRCARGDSCRYSHSMQDAGSGEPGRNKVCFEFQKGSCTRGDSSRQHQPPGPCWFCLSSSEAETHLVVSVGTDCYLALAKGGILPEHVLLLPIEHFPSCLQLPPAIGQEVERYKEALRKCFAAVGKDIFVFERYLNLRAGTHCHVQARSHCCNMIMALVCPISREARAFARRVLDSHAERAGFAFVELPQKSSTHAKALSEDGDLLEAAGGAGAQYFLAELPDGTRLVHMIKHGEKSFPMQFGRDVLAEMLNMPERADWKACRIDKAEEERLAEKFKSTFEPFDVMAC